MFPQSIAALIGFLVFVAPGIFAERLRASRRPTVSESAFREASRIVLASVLFSGTAFAILAGIGAWRPHWMPAPGEWIANGNAYFEEHYRLVARAAAIDLGLSMFLVLVAEGGVRLLRQATGRERARISPFSAWHIVFRTFAPNRKKPFAQVHLLDGTVYRGTVLTFSPEPEMRDRELVLGQPLVRKRPGEIEFGELGKQWISLIIPGPQIGAIRVGYRTPEPTPRRPEWWQTRKRGAWKKRTATESATAEQQLLESAELPDLGKHS